MRLYWNGRSRPDMLLRRLEQATTQPITSLLLSNWNVVESNENDEEEDTKVLVDALCDFLQQSQHWEEITLNNCHGDLQYLVTTILQVSPKRWTIRYDKQQSQIPNFVTQGLRNFQSSNPPTITHLSLQGMTLTSSALQSLAVFTQLKSLHVKGQILLAKFDREATSILTNDNSDTSSIPALHELVGFLHQIPDLERLDVEQCHLTDHDLSCVIEATRKHNHLAQLALRGNRMHWQTATTLQEWLQEPQCSLKDLDLSWQRQPSSRHPFSPLQHVDCLAQGLSINTSLQILRLSENRLEDFNVEHLFSALANNPQSRLTKLECKDCHLALSAFEIMARYLPALTTLQQLHLNGSTNHSQLSSRSSDQRMRFKQVFQDALSHNWQLQQLVLPDYESQTLNFFLERNRLLANQFLHQERLPRNLWPSVLERANRCTLPGREAPRPARTASMMYSMLRQGGYQCLEPPHHCADTSDNSTTMQKIEQRNDLETVSRPRIRTFSNEDGAIELLLASENTPNAVTAEDEYVHLMDGRMESRKATGYSRGGRQSCKETPRTSTRQADQGRRPLVSVNGNY